MGMFDKPRPEENTPYPAIPRTGTRWIETVYRTVARGMSVDTILRERFARGDIRAILHYTALRWFAKEIETQRIPRRMKRSSAETRKHRWYEFRTHTDSGGKITRSMLPHEIDVTLNHVVSLSYFTRDDSLREIDYTTGEKIRPWVRIRFVDGSSADVFAEVPDMIDENNLVTGYDSRGRTVDCETSYDFPSGTPGIEEIDEDQNEPVEDDEEVETEETHPKKRKKRKRASA